MSKNFFIKKYLKKTKADNKVEKDNKNNEVVNSDKNDNLYFEKLEDNTLTNLLPRKRLAAILLGLIGIDKAAGIIKKFNEKEVIKLAGEMLKLEKITEKDIKELQKEINVNNFEINDNIRDYTRELLHKAFGITQGSRYFIKCFEESENESPLAFLEKLPKKNILDILNKESDAVVAIVLSMFDSKLVSEIIKLMPKGRSIEILRRISKGLEVNPAVLDTIIDKLRDKAVNIVSYKTDDMKGKQKLVEILKYSSYDRSLSIIDDLAQTSPDLAEELKEQIFTFNDVVTIPKKSLDYALTNYPDEDISFMLKGAPDDMKKIFFKSLTKNRKEIINDEMKFLGKVKKRDVDEKRKDFVEYLRKLEDEGKIILNPDNEEYVE